MTHRWFDADRNRHVEGAPDFDAEELWWRDADHREWNPIDDNRRTDDIGRPSETALPQCGADHRNRAILSTSAHIVIRGEGAADEC